MRFVPSQTPRSGPWRSIASIVYVEHDGTNRHDDGRIADGPSCHSRIGAISTALIRPATRSTPALFQRPREVVDERGEGPCQAFAATDQDVVGVGNPVGGKNLPHQRAEAALEPVADDRIADLPGDGEARAHRQGIVAAANEENETGRRRTAGRVRSDKVAPRGDGRDRRPRRRDYALSFVRPLARRFASTLRPPGVAIRARNP